MFLTHATNFGILRIVLLFSGIVLAFLVPEPQTHTIIEWPLIVPTLIAPALTPLIVMVIFLDLIMAMVFSADAPDKKRHYRRVMLANIIVVTVIIVRWLPFFMTLGRPG